MGKYNLKNMKSLIIIILLATAHLATITDDYPPTNSTMTNSTNSTTTNPATPVSNTSNLETSAMNSCSKDKFCQGCEDGKCTSCFSLGIFGTGKIGARYLIDGHCKNQRTAYSNCQYYKSTSKQDNGDLSCARCNHWLNIDLTASLTIKYCSTAAASFLKDTAVSECISVPNCSKNSCVKTSSSTYSSCLICDRGYWPYKDVSGAFGCHKMGDAPIKNVSQWKTWNDKIEPHECEEGYYLSNDETKCDAVKSFDQNCRRLTINKNAAECAECKQTYYFDGSKCILESKL